jgi:hypothetical protein
VLGEEGGSGVTEGRIPVNQGGVVEVQQKQRHDRQYHRQLRIMTVLAATRRLRAAGQERWRIRTLARLYA